MSDLDKEKRLAEEGFVQVGGTIEKAEKGEYNLNINAILSEAWESTRSSRLSINIAFIFTIFLAMLLSMIAGHYMGGLENVLADERATWLLNIVITLIISPFLAGIEMMGVYHAIKLKTHSRLVFAFLSRGSFVAICALLSSSITTLGFQLLFLPGIYLMVALSLTMPLIIEKHMSPIKAMVCCLKATRFQWFKMFAIYFLVSIGLFIVSIPLIMLDSTAYGLLGVVLFVFGFSYLVPLFYNVKGILYREIFGLTLHSVNGENIHQTFSA